MRTSIVLLSAVSVALVACGETPPPVTPAPATSAAAVVPTTPEQLKLAHFITPDGMHGFVLDRSAEPYKLRLDGSTDVVELTKQEDRHAGDLRGYWLLRPDGTRPVYLSKSGGLTLYLGRDEFHVTGDRTVEALPAPTVAGQYVPPKPAYQATVDRLTAVAVRTKLPEMKAEDSAKLDKIGEAMAKATPDMFVHFVARGQDSWVPRQVVVPDGFSGIGFGGVAYKSDDKWEPGQKGAKGLAVFGGKNRGFSTYGSRGNHMQVSTLEGYPPKLADGTPGLVWEVDGTSAVFVTLDGLRFTVDLSAADKGQTLDAGAGPADKWPAPLQYALLDVPMVSSYAKAGAMPQKAIDDLLKLDEEWNLCAQKTWKGAEKKVDTHQFNEADRKEWTAKVEKACKKHVDAQEKLLVTLIDERLKARKELFEKAKGRVR
jgi:hypothetical protein